MFAMPFTKAARENKRLKVILKTTKEFIYAHEDLPEFGESNEKMRALRAALDARDGEKCIELLSELDPPKSFQGCREWLDILVVSISVAMAFRAYFYEPFNIPTGSMQPTLYGNHSETLSPEKATDWDTTPLKWVKWLATGKMYECFRAPFNGMVQFRQTNTGYYDMRVVDSLGNVSKSMMVPTDVLHPTETGDGPYRQQYYSLPNGLRPGDFVREGQVLWSGLVVTGDFLFVNRWMWNFRHPRRGDVMIFATTGIEGLQQGTHYIKRMVGTPGETISIVDAGEKNGEPAFELRVNGEKPMEPLRIAQIQNHEKWHEKSYPYAGFRPSGTGDPRYTTPGRTLSHAGAEVKLGPDEYFACGDNSPSSYDSRYWGPVPAKNLVGIAGGVFWPFCSHRWGPIK